MPVGIAGMASPGRGFSKPNRFGECDLFPFNGPATQCCLLSIDYFFLPGENGLNPCFFRHLLQRQPIGSCAVKDIIPARIIKIRIMPTQKFSGLVMLFCNAASIRDVILFPLLKPER